MDERSELQPVLIADIEVPAALSSPLVIDGNPIRQIIRTERTGTIYERSDNSRDSDRFFVRFPCEEVRLVRSTQHLNQGERALIPKRVSSLGRRVLRPSDLGDLRWVGNLRADEPTKVHSSLRDNFTFLQDDPTSNQRGLRAPQLGAIHAILAYWTVNSFLPATVVMPTGTGKTDAMVGLFVAARPERLLVIVPSDALRDQLAVKFEMYGVLQETGVVGPTALLPVVGRVEHGFKSAEAAGDYALRCNIIVATPNALMASTQDARRGLLEACSHLFVDEAHHVAATTWKRICDEFADRPVVQFTATPFREDGRRMGGRIIYSFPLREAQKYGYFSRINYYSVVDFENQDRAVAAKALEVLRSDLGAGFDHILMARVSRIGRAQEVVAIYRTLAPDLAPVLLHSGVGARERKTSLQDIRSRHSRIVVCVDMLGEGFDLPSLKVAAIHDVHRSLGVTLQFVGRFARVAGATIGEATVIVARPDSDYDDVLRKLYAENADWNDIIRNLSEVAIGEQEAVSEFEAAFNSLPDEVSLANLLPKMSTVVYQTGDSLWAPENAESHFRDDAILTSPIPVNTQDHVAWFVTKMRSPVPWGDTDSLEDLTHGLYILYWDSHRQLLYINSSDTNSLHEDLAKAVCGPEVERISGEAVYRIMAHIDRLVPTNVGVLDVRNRSRRFSMHVGADVIEGFPIAEAQTKTKTNIFAYGFEAGERVSVGASLKGRVWSYRVAPSLKHWMNWCDHVGDKLIDGSINLDNVMNSFIRPKVLEERPPLVPLAMEWPWSIFVNMSDEVRVTQGNDSWPLIDVDLKITEFSTEGPIPFDVVVPGRAYSFEAVLGDGGVTYNVKDAEPEVVTRFKRTALSAWLARAGLTIHFEQDATVTPDGFLLQCDRTLPPFDRQRLRDLDWTGINIRKESQGSTRDSDSVQARVIQHVLTLATWEVVIDDDGAGEIADIVAMRVVDRTLEVMLVHCKYSSESYAGHRVGDLYEVCGQAQKSVNWKRNVPLMFRHLIRREKRRLQNGGRTGLLVGTAQRLHELAEMSRMLIPHFTIAIAQPGVSKASVSRDQLELLASTEVYVRETANAPLEVFCYP